MSAPYDCVLNKGVESLNEFLIDSLVSFGCVFGSRTKESVLESLRRGEHLIVVKDDKRISSVVKTGLCDIFTVEELLLKYSKPRSVEVNLNDSYKAIVTKDEIKVGCQTFPVSVLHELLKAVESL